MSDWSESWNRDWHGNRSAERPTLAQELSREEAREWASLLAQEALEKGAIDLDTILGARERARFVDAGDWCGHVFPADRHLAVGDIWVVSAGRRPVRYHQGLLTPGPVPGTFFAGSRDAGVTLVIEEGTV